MRIQVTELAEGPLFGLSPVLKCSPDDVLYCSNIRFWDGVYDPDCLYIGHASTLSPQPPDTKERYQVQLLLIEDAPIPKSWLEHPSVKILSFPADTDPFHLFNAISDSGFCLPRYAMKLTELLDAIPEDDFDTIAARVGNILGRPIVLMTPGLRLLASSCSDAEAALSHRQFRQTLRNDLTGHLSPVMLSPGSSQLYPLKSFPDQTGALLFPITHKGELKEVLGYIYCPEIPKSDAVANLPALRYISHLLTARFLRFIREGRGDDAAFSLLIGKIISGEMKDNDMIEALLRQTNFSVPKSMVLITIQADALSPDSIVECADALYRDIWPQARAALIGSQIILLVGSDEDQVITEDELSRFGEHLSEYRCTAGISQPFHRVNRYIRNYFHRTFCAAIVAEQRGGSRYATYGDSALYHLSCDFTNVAALSPFKDAFVDPNLLDLISYDAVHDTDYLTTLRYYWHYNRNSSVICRLLHIQRSKLFYRLTKIREILAQDFNDYQNLIQLSVGISILEARGVLPCLSPEEAAPAPGKSFRDER